MTKARTLADNFAADINGITAGTGITGGGTSGTVTVTNSMATAIDAKGDLVVGTGADTFARLAVASTAGYLLSVDSNETTGLKWAAPAGGGKVLQVVSAAYAVGTTNTTTSYADTNLTATITPTSATSQVLVLVNQGGCSRNAAGTSTGLYLRLMRGATQLEEFAKDWGYTNSALLLLAGSASYSHLDSPATTSATTYKTQLKCGTAGMSVSVQESGSASSIILLEIGA